MTIRNPDKLEVDGDEADLADRIIMLGGDRSTDPAPYSNRMQLYAKRVNGVLGLYMLGESGTSEAVELVSPDEEESSVADIGCSLNATGQSFSSVDGAVALTWVNENYDTDTMWDAGQSSRITFTTAGKYRLWLFGKCTLAAANPTDTVVMQISIKLNGATFPFSGYTAHIPATFTSVGLSISLEASFSANDYIEFFASGPTAGNTYRIGVSETVIAGARKVN
jgi:hypothetical protein